MNTIFSILNFLYFFESWAYFLFLPIYYSNIGYTNMQIGILVSIIPFFSIVFSLPFGIVSDILRPRIVIFIGMLSFLIFSLLIFFIRNPAFPVMLGSLIFFGLSYILFTIGINSFFLKKLDSSKKGKGLGMFYLASYIGFAIGVVVSGYLLDRSTFQNLFLLLTVISGLMLILSLFLPRQNPIKFALADYIRDIKRYDVMLIIIIIFFYGFHTGTEQTSFSLFAKNALGISQTNIGIIFFIVGLWLGVVNLCCSRFFKINNNCAKLSLIALFFEGAFQIATAFADNFSSLLIIRILHTFGDSVVYISRALIVALIFQRARTGGNFGFTFFVQSLGMVFGAFFAGFIQQKTNYGMPFVLSGILLILLSFYLLLNTRYWQLFKQG